MTKQEIITELIEKGYNSDAAATQQDLYTIIRRNQLFSNANRLNSGWTRGKYVIACYADDDTQLTNFLEQWRSKVLRYQNQILCLEITPNNWQFYDYAGNQIEFNVKPPQLQLPLTTDEGTENNNQHRDLPLQQIFYGAPGTGKSNTIKKEVDEKKKICFRTTFHPDSDYSTFVGCYKPTMKVQPLYNQQTGAKIGEEKKIAYTYIPQAFTKAYVKAWQNPTEPVYLIIEEINRGNCAQIFGDIFQLLDRNDQGLSDYPIKADDDLKAHLYECFISNDNLPENIKSGEELQLPSNLYIWATMNTSDQSLFPIDSAFKRRWDWTYMPIYDAKKGWKIEVNGKRYGWWSFLEKINEKIGTTTSSEDKKLGYFFCKTDNKGIISAEKFVGKVIFYLWNDVFKDYAEDSSVFVDEANKAITFNKFYMADSEGRAKVATYMVETFLMKLGVEPLVDEEEVLNDIEIEDEDGNSISSSNRNYDKFSINGEGAYGKNALAANCVKKYIELNPQMTAEEVLTTWKRVGNLVPHFIESLEEHNNRKDKSIRSEEILCGSTSIYVEKNGYGSNGKVYDLIDIVNKKDWGITIKKVE